MKIQASILLAGSCLLVSGCGIRGDLERPAPMWGPDNRTAEEREHETEGQVEPSGEEAPSEDTSEDASENSGGAS